MAGNFAGHLEQAGEASDFVAVVVRDTSAPRRCSLLRAGPPRPARRLPLSGNAIFLPEAAVSGDEKGADRAGSGALVRAGVRGEQVVAIHPRAFGAYNDCSIRRPNAKRSARRRTGVKRARAGPAMLPCPISPPAASSMTTASPAIWSGTASCTPTGSTARRWITATSTASC